MMCWFYAVSEIPISDYTALLYFQPIFTILFAIFILRETAGPRTWGAVAIAFVGRPDYPAPGAFRDISLGHESRANRDCGCCSPG
jgi:Permeases of the drug/metabolite transporter (DMT) superfamily